jgi:hypothetical protein
MNGGMAGARMSGKLHLHDFMDVLQDETSAVPETDPAANGAAADERWAVLLRCGAMKGDPARSEMCSAASQHKWRG